MNTSNWDSINPEYVARMRLQNQFKTGIDIAKYTAAIMRKDMEEYDKDPSLYTQSLGCWHGFIGQQKLISIKKHFNSNSKKYLYLSGWMIAALRSEFGPLPDQSMHEKTSVASLINELYTFLKQADARELGGLFRDYDAASDSDKEKRWSIISNTKNFWANLDWMPGAKRLYDFIIRYESRILSAYSNRDGNSKIGKMKWLKKNTKFKNADIHLVMRSEKQNYAVSDGKPNVLIDDHPKNIREWEAKGGIGILHTSVSKSMSELKRLGFK